MAITKNNCWVAWFSLVWMNCIFIDGWRSVSKVLLVSDKPEHLNLNITFNLQRLFIYKESLELHNT